VQRSRKSGKTGEGWGTRSFVAGAVRGVIPLRDQRMLIQGNPLTAQKLTSGRETVSF
jgi:hypothetical protein